MAGFAWPACTGLAAGKAASVTTIYIVLITYWRLFVTLN
jgi:hypothetical protein